MDPKDLLPPGVPLGPYLSPQNNDSLVTGFIDFDNLYGLPPLKTIRTWQSFNLNGIPAERLQDIPPDFFNYGQKVVTLVNVPEDQLNGDYVVRFHMPQPSQLSIDTGYALARAYPFVQLKRSITFVQPNSLTYQLIDPTARLMVGDTVIAFCSSSFNMIIIGIPRQPSTIPDQVIRPSIIRNPNKD